MNHNKALSVLSTLVRDRDVMKKFYGSEYTSRVKPHIAIIKIYMKQSGKNEIRSLMEILKSLQKVEADGMTQALFIAAAVDMTTEESE